MASPWVAAALAVGAPLAGFWAGTQGAAIHDAVSLIAWLQPPPWQLLGVPAVFWVLVGIIAVLGLAWVVHKYADAANVNDRQMAVVEMFEQATRLGLSRGLNALRESVERAHYAYLVATLDGARGNDRARRRTRLEESIRQVLGHMALFARELDAAPSSTTYSAAIYIFHSSARLRAMPDADRELLLGRERFVFYDELPRDPAQISGVLEMRPELSTRALDTEGFAPDPTSPQIVLPVPRPDNGFATVGGRERWKGLPGAPYTALTQKAVPFESIEAVVNWIDAHADLTAATRQRLLSQFDYSTPGHGRNEVRSFLPLPIVMPAQVEEQQAQRVLVGVAVIQSSAANLLAGHRHETFANVGTPFLVYLASLVVDYLAA